MRTRDRPSFRYPIASSTKPASQRPRWWRRCAIVVEVAGLVDVVSFPVEVISGKVLEVAKRVISQTN